MPNVINSTRNKFIFLFLLSALLGIFAAVFQDKIIALPIVPLVMLLITSPFGLLVFLAFLFHTKNTVSIGSEKSKKQETEGYADVIKEITIEGKIISWSDYFGAPIRVAPSRPDDNRIILSYNLIKEELEELEGHVFDIDDAERERRLMMECFGKFWLQMNSRQRRTYKDRLKEFIEQPEQQLPVKKYINLKHVADDLGDILWVTYRKFMEYGLNPFAIVGEIHRANMTKLADSEQVAQATVDHYAKLNINAAYRKNGEKYVIYNIESGKILKSILWEEPNFDFLGNVESLVSKDSVVTNLAEDPITEGYTQEQPEAIELNETEMEEEKQDASI